MWGGAARRREGEEAEEETACKRAATGGVGADCACRRCLCQLLEPAARRDEPLERAEDRRQLKGGEEQPQPREEARRHFRQRRGAALRQEAERA